MVEPKSAGKAKPAGRKASAAKPPVLLSGGNPQIPKGYGDAPVAAYIAALPGWKRDRAAALDALITDSVPGVHKAVKWNSLLYGIEGHNWFAGLHAFNLYLKLSFFSGAELDPVPPEPSKVPGTRYLNIREADGLDPRLADWMRQAALIPGLHGMGK